MSVSSKKRAKSIRKLFQVGRGVREAHGESCRDRDTIAGKLQPECRRPARVVVDGEGICDRHWERRKQPRR